MSPVRIRCLAHTLFAVLVVAALFGSGAARGAEPGEPLPGFAPFAQRLGPVDGQETATGVAVRSDGRVVASVVNDVELDRRAIGLAANGALDTTFSDDGMWSWPQPNTTVVRAIAPLPDGKTIFVGDDQSQQAIVIGRLMKDGELDPTFGGDGFKVFATGDATNPQLEHVHVQSDGKIVFAGSRVDGAKGSQLLIGRLNADGSDDATFVGVPYSMFGSPLDGVDDHAAGVARMPNGELILGSALSTGKVGILRIGPSANFAVIKELTLPDATRTVDVTPVDATHVVALTTSASVPTALARIDVEATPKPDPTFAGDGVATPFPASFLGTQVLRQADGKFLVAGFDTVAGQRAVARVNADGTLDASFAASGIRLLDGAAAPWASIRAHELALSPDGTITSASHVGTGGGSMTAVDRIVGRLARVQAQVLTPVAAPVTNTSTQVILRVTNAGPDDAGATTLAFTLPADLVLQTTSIPCVIGAQYTCQLASVPAGQSRDVTIQVKRAQPGTSTIAMSVDPATYDDVPGDDSSSLAMSFSIAIAIAPPPGGQTPPPNGDAVTPPPAGPGAGSVQPGGSTKPPTLKPTGPILPLMTIRKITKRNGTLLWCGRSVRLACVTSVIRSRRSALLWLRASSTPVPATVKRRVSVLVQRKEGRRWVKRGDGTLDLRANGRLDFQLPREMRGGRALWRVLISVRATKTTKAARSTWFYVRVR